MPKSTSSKIGSKIQVWNNTAQTTPGGLRKNDLMKNKHGKVVSIKQHKNGLKAFDNLKPYFKQQ